MRSFRSAARFHTASPGRSLAMHLSRVTLRISTAALSWALRPEDTRLARRGSHMGGPLGCTRVIGGMMLARNRYHGLRTADGPLTVS